MWDIYVVLVLHILVIISEDLSYFPPPAGSEAGPDGDPQLVGGGEVGLDQGYLLPVTLQRLLYVPLLQSCHVVHLQLDQLIGDLRNTILTYWQAARIINIAFSEGLEEEMLL